MIFEKIQLEEDEEIISIIRRHWFFLCIQALPMLLIALLPLLLGIVALAVFNQILAPLFGLFLPQILFLYACWILCIWMLLATVWTDYYLDIWCITNKRIIKIDQEGLFRRKTGSFRLERMQDVQVEINGIIATLLDYGSVHVQTASAELDEFKAIFLPKPQEIKSLILQAGDKLLEKNTPIDQTV